ncbi:hypothetical protein TRAPUB_4822 [Trametes pubescens]|uniref:EKC/KEOPS complex subunit GON7 n=1 Tax=Trametes pubescens TaxID=154538 RepID=A0A1M2VAF0_TRAPU|nr:hypothetical protein TRAPUB_4822 [Trametes pubescens]
MSSAISVTYELNPPADTPIPGSLTSTKSHQFPLAKADAAGQKEYYEGLRAAVLQAKSTLGEELTAWRDVVGKREENKEAKIPKKSEDDEDEETEE